MNDFVEKFFSKINDFHYVKSVRIRSFFDPNFPTIRTEYWDLQSKSPYSVRMRENADQKSSEYGHFLRSAFFVPLFSLPKSD